MSISLLSINISLFNGQLPNISFNSYFPKTLTLQQQRIAIIALAVMASYTIWYCIKNYCFKAAANKNSEIQESVLEKIIPTDPKKEKGFAVDEIENNDEDFAYSEIFDELEDIEAKKNELIGSKLKLSTHSKEAFKDQKATKAKMILADGTILEGDFDNGLLTGKGKTTYPNGKIVDGYYKNGVLNGKGKITDKHFNVMEGIFENGNLKEGRREQPNRATYIGEFNNGYLTKGKIIHENITFEIEKYNLKEKNGNGKIIIKENTIAFDYEGDIFDGKEKGKIHTDKEDIEGFFEDCLLNGEGNLCKSGMNLKGIFKNGQLENGKIEEIDGTIKEGEFSNGRLVKGKSKNGKTGACYDGTFLGDSFHEGTIKSVDGKRFIGKFDQGRLIEGSISLPNGTNFQVNKDISKITHPSGILCTEDNNNNHSEIFFPNGYEYHGKLFLGDEFWYEDKPNQYSINGEGQIKKRGLVVYEGQFLKGIPNAKEKIRYPENDSLKELSDDELSILQGSSVYHLVDPRGYDFLTEPGSEN